jgi:hypothetical protein
MGCGHDATRQMVIMYSKNPVINYRPEDISQSMTGFQILYPKLVMLDSPSFKSSHFRCNEAGRHR